ncbi:TetR/AcrR family transcriptional regulator [Sphingomonas koreensis]|nr:TetR/AcrR family transcriptional regulator [Sphingomonas koreensis]
MGLAERRARERGERERRITQAARRIAAADGWSAVTIRRLANAIEYSQPVLYSHFGNRDAIVAAVAVEGFAELAKWLRSAAEASPDPEQAIRQAGAAYLDFAREEPTLYEAMFVSSTDLQFAQEGTKAELKDAFAALHAVVAPSGVEGEVATETFWAALHGLAELERSGRIRPQARDQRLDLIANCIR